MNAGNRVLTSNGEWSLTWVSRSVGPIGEIFGTICVYDNKSNEYSQLYLRQLLLWRDVLQNDLKTLATLHSQLEQHEAKIRRLVDANIIGIIIWDFDGRVLEANDEFLRMVNYDREDLALAA